MATFSYPITFGAQLKREPKVKVVQFGDGYEQRIQFGINADPMTWDVRCFGSTSEMDLVDNFLTARGALESFDWTPPDKPSGKYVCRSWTRLKEGVGKESVSATFIQVFE